MEKLNLELNWNIPPKNGLNQFISPELYAKYSVTYKLTNESLCNYYAKFLNDKEDTEEQKSESPKNKRKEKKKSNGSKGRTSSLSSREQKKYLFLLQKFSTKVISIDTPEEEKKAIEDLMHLHQKVVAEQKEFTEYQKANAGSSTDYKFVHPEASRYVKEHLQRKLQSCFSYPRHYVIGQKFSLLEEVKIDSSILPSLVCNLLELGKAPRLALSGRENSTIPCNFAKMCKHFPVSSETSAQHPSKQPISQDSVAKTLADKHSADMVLTFSSLKHLLICGSQESGTSWELPVTVVSLQTGENDCSTKRVFIDKAIPVGMWFPSRKNVLYHKYGTKLHFTHCRPSKSSRKPFPCNQGGSEVKQQIRELVDLQDDFFETEENFDYETFGQIKCSEEKEVPMESGNKTFDSVCKSVNASRSAGANGEKEKDNTSSEKESFPVKMECNQDSFCGHNKETDSVIKKADLKVEGNVDAVIESKDFSEVSNSSATCQPDKDALCKYLQLMNKDSALNSESKTNNANVDDQKTLDGCASEEGPKCKRRKTKSEQNPVPTGRRVTRSQTKKLEDAVKQPKQSVKPSAKKEAASSKQNIDSKSEIPAERISPGTKGGDEQCLENTRMTKEVESVEPKEAPSHTKENIKEEASIHKSENSIDTFPRPPLKKVFSSDDDSDDNLVIDETVLSDDDKQTDLDKVSKSAEADTIATKDENLTQDNKISETKSDLQSEEVNAQKVPNKESTTQNEKQQQSTPDKTVHSNEMSPDDKKNVRSTLDQILHLQEEMLKPKQKPLKAELLSSVELSSPTEQKVQGFYGPHPGLPTYLEDANQFPPFDPSLNTNVQYSLWNMGQLKVIMRSKLDSRQLSSTPCFIFSKLEHQPNFGAEICTTEELLHQWITLVCHPGSTGLRVRIDAQTSKVLMTEELTLPSIHNLVAKFSPERPLCWVIHVLEKLKELPNGQYLLVHQKMDEAVTLHAASDGNKRGDYDLHTAIRQRLVALDDNAWEKKDCSETEIPWLPIDPDIMLPSLISRYRIPATFSPGNESKTTPQTKKKAAKKKSKKSKTSKLKQQQS